MNIDNYKVDFYNELDSMVNRLCGEDEFYDGPKIHFDPDVSDILLLKAAFIGILCGFFPGYCF